MLIKQLFLNSAFVSCLLGLLCVTVQCTTVSRKSIDSQQDYVNKSPRVKDFASFLDFEVLRAFEVGYLGGELFAQDQTLQNRQVLFLPQVHSSTFMYMEEKSLRASTKNLDTFVNASHDLLAIGRSQYLILKRLHTADLEGVEIINEGSPALTPAISMPSQHLRALLAKLFPSLVELKFEELTETQLQVLGHMGAVNILYALGRISVVNSEDPICPKNADIPAETPPSYEGLSEEEEYRASYLSPTGPENALLIDLRKNLPEFFKFWVTDREERLLTKVRNLQHRKPSSKLLIVFGGLHYFPNFAEFTVHRYLESTDIFSQMSFERVKALHLDETHIRLSPLTKSVLTEYLNMIWKSFDRGFCTAI